MQLQYIRINFNIQNSPAPIFTLPHADFNFIIVHSNFKADGAKPTKGRKRSMLFIEHMVHVVSDLQTDKFNIIFYFNILPSTSTFSL
jgi:hypothetical protein